MEEEEFLLDDNKTGLELSPQIISDLRVTSGWLRYLGILGFVLTVLILLIAFVALFRYLGSGMNLPNEFYLSIIFSVVFFGLIMYMSILLFQYGNSLKEFIDTGKYYQLEEAFEKQKYYWVVAGISTSIIVGLYLILILISFL